MIKWRDYQEEVIKDGTDIIRRHGFVYLAMEVRTGKTLCSLQICDNNGAKKVLFITKKKAISSIEKDIKTLSPSYESIVINYESLHKVDTGGVDHVIIDEAHSIGAFPKPSGRQKKVAQVVKNTGARVVYLSGTPTPESFSQMYHQVSFLPKSPFSEFSNFYRFANVYVDVKTKMINGRRHNDYKEGKEDIIKKMEPYTIRKSQSEAGFKSKIDEEMLFVEPSPMITMIADKLKKDLVVPFMGDFILADTPVKLQQKLHQIYSGSVILEDSGLSAIIDLAKANFIKKRFAGSKIGIFYVFKAELEMLKQVFGDQLTESQEEFDSTDKNIALQVRAGREGVSLKNAEYLVYYNIEFSATTYWQSRDRMTTIDRKFNKVYWIFTRGGIEERIYKAVLNKKSYTLSHFKKDFL
jgi:hypothetical protein